MTFRRTRRSSSTWSCSTSSKLDLVIDHLNAQGDGVARHARQVITVPFTIPGEHVRVSVHVARDGSRVGTIEEVLLPSPHRVEPRCPHFGVPRANLEVGPYNDGGCGGCSWQHIAYAEQLRLKSEMLTRLVREALPRAPEARPAIPGTPAEAPWGYRQKVHFVFGSDRGSQLAMGHYARGSRRVIPVTTCPVHDERGNALAFHVWQALRASGIEAAHEPAVKGLAVRAGAHTNELMATLVLSGDADRHLRAATRRAIDLRTPSSFHVNIHPRRDAYIFGRETRRISGAERLREEVAGISFLISPTSFFQTNVRAAEILAGLVTSAIPRPSHVLDLYAGAGLFALPLARAGHRVVAIEENREAIADGEASRRLNKIDEENCRFVCRRVEESLRLGSSRLAHGRRSSDRYDAVVLDPPRAGCSPGVIEGVFGKLRPPLAVYVSCNPEALARDLREVVRLGYDIESLQPVDMFPHTAHIETVALLNRP